MAAKPSPPDITLLKKLVEDLKSDDAFDRREAIESLAILTQQRLNFAWQGADAERMAALGRWRKWIEREERRRRGRQVQATIQILASGVVNPVTLHKTLKDLPEAAKQALLAQVFAKMSAAGLENVGHPTCESCHERPATVVITLRQDDGTFARQRQCELCAHEMDG